MSNLDPRKRSNLIPRGEKGKCRWCNKDVPKGRRSWCSDECVDDALIRTQPGYARKKVEARDKGVCAECQLDTRAMENTLRRVGAIANSGMDAYDRTSNKAARRYGLTIQRLYKVINAGQTDFEAAIMEAKELDRVPGPGQPLKYGRRPTPPLPVTVAEQRVRRLHKRLMKLAAARLKRLCREYAAAGFDGISTRTGHVLRSLWDADHIVPVVKGGGGCGLENYRTLCQPCHKIVTARLAAERAAERRGTDPQQSLF